MLPQKQKRVAWWAAFSQQDMSEKTSEKTLVKASEKTSEKILIEICGNRNVTIAELSRIVGVTTRSVERNLKKLQESGRLERIGPDKGGHWVVRKNVWALIRPRANYCKVLEILIFNLSLIYHIFGLIYQFQESSSNRQIEMANRQPAVTNHKVIVKRFDGIIKWPRWDRQIIVRWKRLIIR